MFLFFSSLSADVCLSVQVYRWITLVKHWAFALNRQHRYSQLMFSLSGATLANHTLYGRATGKATGHSFIMVWLHCAHVRVHAYITMGLNYAWPSLISFHLSHVFRRAPQLSYPNLHLCCWCRVGVRSEEAWAGTRYSGYDYHGQKYLGKQCYLCFESKKKCCCFYNVMGLLNSMFCFLPFGFIIP